MSRTCIHIGLPKAASTYLQHHVQPHNAVSFVDHVQLKALRLAAFGEQSAKQASAMLREEVERKRREHAACIVSDERLSSWRHFDFRFLTQSQVQSYQRRCSEILARVFGPARILLLARNPRDWLRSLHGQFVKAGESRSLTEFCLQNKAYLLQAAHLDDLAQMYADAFGPEAVTIFPVEAMETGKLSDWRIWLNQEFDLHISWSQEPRYRNLGAKTVEAVRQGNRVIDYLARSSTIDDARVRRFKDEVFRFLECTLVDQPANQRLLRRLIGANLVQSSPPEGMVEEMLYGLSRTTKRDTFDSVRGFYV